PPLCQCGSIMRPDVVWFGEPLPHDALEAASRAAAESDAMLVVGTSAVVYPAAALPVIAKNSGSLVVEVNVEPTDVTGYADLLLQGRAGEVLPALWTMILEPERFMTEHPVLPNR
ncbi:MAG: Sir2 family NAD-dependent protein deacetylase, partial [Thermoplasmata archaeon]